MLNFLCFLTKYESVSTSTYQLRKNRVKPSTVVLKMRRMPFTNECMVRHHCLYGNELADSEDVRWWLKQRQGAPLDHQAGIERLPFDSVGCMRVDRTTIK